MKLEDYMNPVKFPVTSQEGLSPQEQLMIDAINHDQLEEAIADGIQMNAKQTLAWAELQTKAPWMKEMSRQITAQKKAAQDLAKTAQLPTKTN